MATIKTIVDEAGVRRVITKLVDEERKVSCSCCTPTVCCMYPADQLGVGYTEIDLPDTIQLDLLFDTTPGVSIVTLSRNGDQYGPYTANGVSTYLLVELNEFLEPSWYLFSTDGDPLFDQYAEYNSCLFFNPPPDLNSQRIEDNFQDTYEVSGPVSGTVTRQSICVWTGTGLTLSNYGYQWTVNGRAKSGNQNTPVGSYADGYSVSA
jgi:hypothetical protein